MFFPAECGISGHFWFLVNEITPAEYEWQMTNHWRICMNERKGKLLSAIFLSTQRHINVEKNPLLAQNINYKPVSQNENV